MASPDHARELVLYHLVPTRSCRVLWLLKELDIEVKTVIIDFLSDKKALQNPDLLAVNPSGRLPALKDGDVCIAQSGACVLYILERYAGNKLQPDANDFQGRATFLKYIFLAESDIMEPAAQVFAHGNEKVPKEERLFQLAESGRQSCAASLDLLDKYLQGKEYLVNDKFSAADIMMGVSLNEAATVGLLGDKYQNIHPYFNRLKERPAFKDAFKKDA